MAAPNTITTSPEFREVERLREKARHDEAQALHHAEQKGISRRNVEIARRMLTAGEPVERIMLYTDLTAAEIEELERQRTEA